MGAFAARAREAVHQLIAPCGSSPNGGADKEVWWCAFETEEQALEAVGLSEQDAHADS